MLAQPAKTKPKSECFLIVGRRHFTTETRRGSWRCIRGETRSLHSIVAPLQYSRFAAYQKDYEYFLAQYEGPIDVEYRDMHVAASGDLGYAFGLERMSGTLKGGQKSDMWIRFTSIFRKMNGQWKDVHDHISMPADLDTGKARLDLKP